jgi:hypothetical protein
VQVPLVQVVPDVQSELVQAGVPVQAASEVQDESVVQGPDVVPKSCLAALDASGDGSATAIGSVAIETPSSIPRALSWAICCCKGTTGATEGGSPFENRDECESLNTRSGMPTKARHAKRVSHRCQSNLVMISNSNLRDLPEPSTTNKLDKLFYQFLHRLTFTVSRNANGTTRNSHKLAARHPADAGAFESSALH